VPETEGEPEAARVARVAVEVPLRLRAAEREAWGVGLRLPGGVRLRVGRLVGLRLPGRVAGGLGVTAGEEEALGLAEVEGEPLGEGLPEALALALREALAQALALGVAVLLRLPAPAPPPAPARWAGEAEAQKVALGLWLVVPLCRLERLALLVGVVAPVAVRPGVLLGAGEPLEARERRALLLAVREGLRVERAVGAGAAEPAPAPVGLRAAVAEAVLQGEGGRVAAGEVLEVTEVEWLELLHPVLVTDWLGEPEGQ
jgi:hypothetical protein